MLPELLQLRNKTPLKSYNSLKAWHLDYVGTTKNQQPIDKAIIGGFLSHQFSFAFMAGYQAALSQMFPKVAPNQLKALCASEAGGVHPKSIETTLQDLKVNGTKTYVTGGTATKHLLVLCKTDQVNNNRPVLKMVHIENEAEGATVSNFDLPFMKEVKHGRVTFDQSKISASQVLDGDGYDDYTRPFRTLEDICVGSAYRAMLYRQAIENNWDETLKDQLLLSLHTMKYLINQPPLDKETHLLLNASEEIFLNLLPQIEDHIDKQSTAAFRTDWETNKRAMSLGKQIKEIRLKRARLAFSYKAKAASQRRT